MGVIGALGLSGFLAMLLSCTHLLIMDFFQVVSASGCRLVKSNHLNICVVCNYLIFVIPHSSYFSHLTGLGKYDYFPNTTNIIINSGPPHVSEEEDEHADEYKSGILSAERRTQGRQPPV